LSHDDTSLAPDADNQHDRPLPVVTATLSLRGFIDDWSHCQHVAEFVARFAASDRFDPEQLTTRLATYLHELLELVLRCHNAGEAPGGELVVAIVRRADRLQLAVAVPVDAASGERLRRSVRRAGAGDPAAAYHADFAGIVAGDDDAGAGLLELVALHGVVFAARDDGDVLTLTLTVPHE